MLYIRYGVVMVTRRNPNKMKQAWMLKIRAEGKQA